MRYTGVPMIRQEKRKSCWHASARMLWGFKYKQCINPLRKAFDTNVGISPKQFVALAKELGLATVRSINMSYTSAWLDNLLRQHGPIWAAGYWYGPPHVIVITGVNAKGAVYVNDPGFGRRVHNMRFFNEKVASNVANPLMFLPNSVANRQGFAAAFLGEGTRRPGSVYYS